MRRLREAATQTSTAASPEAPGCGLGAAPRAHRHPARQGGEGAEGDVADHFQVGWRAGGCGAGQASRGVVGRARRPVTSHPAHTSSCFHAARWARPSLPEQAFMQHFAAGLPHLAMALADLHLARGGGDPAFVKCQVQRAVGWGPGQQAAAAGLGARAPAALRP